MRELTEERLVVLQLRRPELRSRALDSRGMARSCPACPADAPEAHRRPSTPARRPLPAAGQLRRERRALLRRREERIRDLGGIVLEMVRRDEFREDLVYEQAAELIGLEDRLHELETLLAAATGVRRAPPSARCSAAHRCSGGSTSARTAAARSATAVVACASCGHALPADAKFCASCGATAAHEA